MKVKFVYKFLPALVLYTNKMPQRFSGYTIGTVILIRPRARGDIGLLEHELTHVRQFYRTLGMHALLYKFSKKYRLRAEVEAYKEQLQHPPATNDPERYRKRFAKYIAQKYDLSVSEEEAEDMLCS